MFILGSLPNFVIVFEVTFMLEVSWPFLRPRAVIFAGKWFGSVDRILQLVPFGLRSTFGK